jgi:hypothetical protein
MKGLTKDFFCFLDVVCDFELDTIKYIKNISVIKIGGKLGFTSNKKSALLRRFSFYDGVWIRA